MSAAAREQAPRRVACASCRQPILEGARKCKHCKAWQPERARAPRAAILMIITLTSVFSVIVTSKPSAVGKAPPLTTLAGDVTSSAEPSPLAVGPEPARTTPKPPPVPAPIRTWKRREIVLGDIHPLDVAFSPSGESFYVTGDDATVREYLVESGDMVHKSSLPVKGDRLVPLFDRYLAVLRLDPKVSRVPVLDVTRWDYDPLQLEVGSGPADVVEMPDGTVVIGSTMGHRVSRFGLPSGNLVSDITLPHSTGQLFLVRSEGRPYLAALGAMTHSGRPAGAWLDLFDPEEDPFGATRRSVSVGRDPRPGGLIGDGSRIFFPDFATNSVTVIDLGDHATTQSVDVGQGPIAGFIMAGDRYGVTLNGSARTASVVDLTSAAPGSRLTVSTLMLAGEPRAGRMSQDHTALFVPLGGREEPPRGQGVAIIAGDPPSVVATLPTGEGAMSVAVSKDGARAAVANYFAKSITILE
ncbi:MAG: hypothetical protein U0271_14145 [Polyangiaceae bacterium]